MLSPASPAIRATRTVSRCPPRRLAGRRPGPPALPRHAECRRPAMPPTGCTGRWPTMTPRDAPYRPGRRAGRLHSPQAYSLVLRRRPRSASTHVVAYFENSNGMFAGDDVRILGVQVGKIDKHRAAAHQREDHILGRRQVPGPRRRQSGDPVAATGDRSGHPVDPAYTAGPAMADGAVIPQDRTAVPVEWDDFRVQLQRLTETAAAHRAGRGQHARRVRQHHRRQPARAGRQHPRHHHQAVAGAFSARRSQRRHLHHVQEPVDAGVGAARQRRPDASNSTGTWRR